MDIFKDQYKRYNTNAIKYTFKERLFGANDVLPMWVADMDIPSPSAVIEDMKRRLEHPILGYETFPLSAKTAQKNWLKYNHDLEINEEDIVYSHSVVTSINIAINAFTKKGDSVIIQPPVYPPFFNTIKNNKRKIILNNLKKDSTGHYSFDLKDLKKKITKKTKLLILCSPHNPIGRVWNKKELKELCDICLKNNILIFSDEIHSDLIYTPSKHCPTLSINDNVKDITISAYGVGKTFNLASIAISTVVIPNKKLRDKFETEAETFHLSQGNSLGHVAFESAYRNGQKYKEDILKHFQTNIDKLQKLLKYHNNIIKFVKPEGTYLVWLDCSGMKLSDKKIKEFFEQKAKLGLSRGISFGKAGSKYMRINIAVPTLTMNEALRRLDIALREFKK